MALEREYNERVKASYNKGACIKYLMVKKIQRQNDCRI